MLFFIKVFVNIIYKKNNKKEKIEKTKKKSLLKVRESINSI